MFEAVLVGGPHDGAVIETETDGPDVLVVEGGSYRRAGKVDGRWHYRWEQA